ncbi:MAG: sodium:proton antiporter [Flavobacteriales bacterium]|nr:sodium:proton antiporter [Flavobacteriales bacterium]|tara:strand:+ start:1773 stop:3365 length:1593 start_codon:yes stop_codon:yes gene_type:complete
MKRLFFFGFFLVSPQLFAGTEMNHLTWYGIIPALLAIFLAISTKQVVLSLLTGLISGSVIQSFLHESQSYFFGIDKVFDFYLLNSIANREHASILLFSFLIAGSIHIMTKMGAFNGLIQWLSKFAKSKRSALLITYFMGFFVFFDDYANTLVVGNTMQKITDRFKISREKLAFVVDATAAPIASIAFVSTWIGYEIQLIKDGLDSANYDSLDSAYGIFLNSVPYSFYPILMLIFVFILILTGKDFGSMKKFEAMPDQVLTSKVEIQKSIAAVWAIVPIILLLFVTLFGIYITGETKRGVINAIQTGNCYKGLLWGSGSCFFTVFFISVCTKNKVSENLNWMFEGFKSILPALTILILAWGLNGVLEDLKLGDYIGHIMSQSNVSFYIIPLITFILSSLVAFSTGSSFSTMGILIPIVISVCLSFKTTEYFEYSIFYASIASVLSGSVLGDHCSPISDTTVLSSMATGCNHINHVNSQLIYCLVAGGISVLLIFLHSILDLNLIVLYIIGGVLIWLIIKVLGGKKFNTTGK